MFLQGKAVRNAVFSLKTLPLFVFDLLLENYLRIENK